MKTSTFFISNLLIFILFACKNTDTPLFSSENLGKDVYLSENGEYILLSTPQEINNFNFGKSVNLLVQNLTNNVFTYNYSDIKLFILDKNYLWSPINNNVIYTGEDQIVLGDNSNLETPSTVMEVVDANYSSNKSTYLKIVIIGQFLENGSILPQTNKIAVAIDVKLNP